MNFLSGYKTYIVAVAAIFTAIGTYASGTTTVAQTLQLIVTALLGLTIRSGITTEVLKMLQAALPQQQPK